MTNGTSDLDSMPNPGENLLLPRLSFYSFVEINHLRDGYWCEVALIN